MSDLTVPELDALADTNGLEDYPRSATKPDKVAHLTAAGILVDEPGEGATVEEGRPYAALSPTLAAARDAARDARPDLTRTAAPSPVSPKLEAAKERTRAREAEGLRTGLAGVLERNRPDEE